MTAPADHPGPPASNETAGVEPRPNANLDDLPEAEVLGFDGEPGAGNESSAGVSSPPTTGARGEIAGIRATAKWMMGAYGGIGALLITGISLRDVNGIDSAHLWRASVAAAAAFVGVILAISFVARVLAVEEIALPFVETPAAAPRGDRPMYRWLRQIVAHAPLLLSPYRRMCDVLNEVEQFGKEYSRAYLTVEEFMVTVRAGVLPSSTLGDDQRRRVRDDINWRRERLEKDIKPIMAMLTLYAVTYRFRQALAVSGLGAAMVGLGLIGFVASTSHKPATAPVASDTRGRIVVLQLTDAGRARLDADLGAGCGVSPAPALEIASATDGLEVVTFPRGACGALRLTLTSDLGHVAVACPPSTASTAVPMTTKPVTGSAASADEVPCAR